MRRILAVALIVASVACGTKENHDPLPGSNTPVVTSATCSSVSYQAVTLTSTAADSLHFPGLCVRPETDTTDIHAVRREQLQTIVEGDLPFPSSAWLHTAPLGNQQ